MDKECATKYPIMLIHGIGYRDDSKYNYWGKIPEILEERGARVFFGGQDGFGSVKDNSMRIGVELRKLAEEYGKANLIAHSKGGIEARYVISAMDMADKTASLTTMATPHRGIRTMDIMQEKGKLSGFLNLFRSMLVLGGGQLSVTDNDFMQMSADYMSVFNQLVPDKEGVYYQSYAFDMKSSDTDPGPGAFYKTVKKYEGANDGMVSVDSAKWGDFRGVWSGEDGSGISHSMAAGGRGKKQKRRPGFM